MQPTGPISALTDSARELACVSLEWMDGLFDDHVALLWNPPDLEGGEPRTRHLVRESAWYALGLLARDESEDAERAARTLGAVALATRVRDKEDNLIQTHRCSTLWLKPDTPNSIKGEALLAQRAPSLR